MMNIDRATSRLLRACAVLLLAFTAMQPAVAAGYPDKPIRFICTSSAGSPLDAMMRQLGKQLGDELKQSVVVVNMPGGSGAVGMANAMNQPADGYTIVAATGTTSFMMAEGNAVYKPDDFMVIRGLQAEPSAIVVRRDSPYKSLAQLVDALRKTPDKVNVGGYAAAGFHQFVFYRFQQVAHFKTEWVPFQGGNQAAAALMGGSIDVAVMTPSSATGQIKNGDLRLLAISTPTRDRFFPDVPTFKEQGFDVVESIWRGVMVKSGTPPAVIATLSKAFDRIESTPEWQKFMQFNMQSPLHLDAEHMQAMFRSEVDSRREFLKSIGVVK
ncbi:MAG TPA: tripartite tricarboxylate transporter substrate binding protein [Gemmatimonadaceae bacterium]|jgi:tripartite-type tricarboxylate transporter receptor subunit TctC|nr:tripartite tricarboxylate transporter substrate binding protein [Gemmatimonadaceae bacterium]